MCTNALSAGSGRAFMRGGYRFSMSGSQASGLKLRL